jgi:hypothetical protein
MNEDSMAVLFFSLIIFGWLTMLSLRLYSNESSDWKVVEESSHALI